MANNRDGIRLEEQTYCLANLDCADCAAKFEANIRKIEGVKDVKVNLATLKLKVNGSATLEELNAAGAFDEIKVYRESQQSEEIHRSFWRSRTAIEMVISGFFVVIGWFSQLMYGEEHLLTILSFLSAVAIGGYPTARKGIRNLIRFNFDMNVLMTVAVTGAILIGEWGEAGVVAFLFAVSEALESYSMNKARSSIRSLMEIAPKRATLIRNEELVEVAVEELNIGDLILVKPGEKIPMDGIVRKGFSSVNQASITGESIPVAKGVDDEVYAGTINEEGALEIEVTKYVSDTAIAKIIHLVEEAQSERAPSQAFIERFAKYYTPGVMILATLVIVIPPLFLGSDWHSALYNGFALLVVGCPCALVVSTPIAIVSAIGNAAKHGVLVKGGAYLEELGHIKAIAFDKTGTLTQGRPQVTHIESQGDWTEEEVLQIAASIEQYSQHPLAQAIVARAEEAGVPLLDISAFTSITGKGARANIGEQPYWIGNPRLIEEQGLFTEDLAMKIDKLYRGGKTVIILVNQTETMAIISLSDQIRKMSKETILELQKLGIEKRIMLTGDNEASGRAIGKEVGIGEIYAELLPEDKVGTVKTLRGKYKKVAMVGDGVNDAPALATANVGIAMGGAGTDTALETADIALMADDLSKLPFAIRLSRKSLNIIKQNIAFSIGIKLLAILAVFPGWLTLWLAVLSDMGATILVTLNGIRLARFNSFLD